MELVYGRVVTMAPVGELHGDHAGNIYAGLREFVRRHRLGVIGVEIGFRLARDPDLVRAPDVSYTAAGILDPSRDRARFVEGPPTLAVEVVSRATWTRSSARR